MALFPRQPAARPRAAGSERFSSAQTLLCREPGQLGEVGQVPEDNTAGDGHASSPLLAWEKSLYLGISLQGSSVTLPDALSQATRPRCLRPCPARP